MEGLEHKIVKVNGINMHVAEKGRDGPVILFIHGFPELWYSWLHQIAALSSLGFRSIAPDLRGSNSPQSPTIYTCLDIVDDLIGLLDSVAADQDKVFVVGQDWGPFISWYLCLFRPDRVKALVNLSVVFNPRNPWCPVEFEEIEAELEKIGTKRVLKEFLTYQHPGPLFLPKGKGFEQPVDAPTTQPDWLSEEDLKYYVRKFEKTGFTGAINYYRNIDRNWGLVVPRTGTGTQIKVPVKFIVVDLDLTCHSFSVKDFVHKGGFTRDVPFQEEVVIMEGVGHFINQEKPTEINQHIYDLFNKF